MPHKDIESRKKYAAEYYRKHKKKLDEYKKAWVKENPDKAKQHQSTYNTKSVEKRRIYQRYKRYRLTVEMFAAMLEEQQYQCKICSTSFSEKKMFVDHCHLTNEVRGILCPRCNTALGLIDDDLMWLEKAKRYLTEN